jgi:hypothetical protein
MGDVAMANFERRLAVSLDGADILRVALHGIEAEGRVDITVMRADDAPNRVSWIVDWESKTISTSLATATGPQLTCVAACLIGAAGALADCLLRAKSKADVWECVEKNSVGAVFSGLGCVLACF